MTAALFEKETEPRVLIAILAKQKESFLPLYLQCLEELDYPKSAIHLYVRTNNNIDNTESLLREWLVRVGESYASVEFNTQDTPERVELYSAHEWNPVRYKVMGRLRDASLHRAVERGCQFYFTADADNFIRPDTLKSLVALNLPVVAPLLRMVSPQDPYSNFHAAIDEDGYYKEVPHYHVLLHRRIRGLIEVPVVHCTYLVRADMIGRLTYQDRTERSEYVVFSDVARKNAVTQYLDNRAVYGYILFDNASSDALQETISEVKRLLPTS
jgi:hypothetical protein